jgi:hypothetical protein
LFVKATVRKCLDTHGGDLVQGLGGLDGKFMYGGDCLYIVDWCQSGFDKEVALY